MTSAAPDLAVDGRAITRRRSSRALIAVVIVAVGLLRAYAGLSGVRRYSHDAFGVLDGAWRCIHGQVPHADFYTPLGPLIYRITAIGLRLSGGGAEGLGYSQALAGCVLAVWMWWLAASRVRRLPAVLLYLNVLLLAVNPTPVGEPPPNTSCMFYNRYGYALLALLLVEAMAPPSRLSERAEFLGGASTGVLLGLALFLKASYFAAGAALLIALIPCRPQTSRRFTGLSAGFAAVFIGCWASLQFRLGPMWGDLQMAGAAKHAAVSWFIVRNLGFTAIAFPVFVWLASKQSYDSAERRALQLAGFAVCLCGLFLLATNFQFYALPLTSAFAILTLDRVQSKSHTGRLAQAMLLWGGLYVAGALAYDAMGLGFAVDARLSSRAEQTVFHAPVLAGFGSLEPAYVDLVNDGFALLDRERLKDESVMSLDFSNPFSYGLQIPPAPGGATALHYGTNFDDAHHPPAERLIGHADLVMEPIEPSEPHLRIGIPRVFGAYLQAHFRLIGESKHWRLYRRIA